MKPSTVRVDLTKNTHQRQNPRPAILNSATNGRDIPNRESLLVSVHIFTGSDRPQRLSRDRPSRHSYSPTTKCS
eukprot:6914761-Pyramimonas_sp.AAC.1